MSKVVESDKKQPRITISYEEQISYKPIPGYEGLYSVSKRGDVLNNRQSFLMKHTINTGGYHVVTLSDENGQRMFLVHHLVLVTYVGSKPEGLIGSHEDDDKDNNCLDNLKWATSSYNNRRGAVNKKGIAKITEPDVHLIRALSEEGMPTSTIAEKYNVSYHAIWNLLRGSTHKDLYDEVRKTKGE